MEDGKHCGESNEERVADLSMDQMRRSAVVPTKKRRNTRHCPLLSPLPVVRTSGSLVPAGECCQVPHLDSAFGADCCADVVVLLTGVLTNVQSSNSLHQ